jgi:hypothetical protein
VLELHLVLLSQINAGTSQRAFLWHPDSGEAVAFAYSGLGGRAVYSGGAMIATITRCKLYQRTGWFAWKYLYSATGLPIELQGFDRLDSIRSKAKELGAEKIVLAWKPHRMAP